VLDDNGRVCYARCFIGTPSVKRTSRMRYLPRRDGWACMSMGSKVKQSYPLNYHKSKKSNKNLFFWQNPALGRPIYNYSQKFIYYTYVPGHKIGFCIKAGFSPAFTFNYYWTNDRIILGQPRYFYENDICSLPTQKKTLDTHEAKTRLSVILLHCRSICPCFIMIHVTASL